MVAEPDGVLCTLLYSLAPNGARPASIDRPLLRSRLVRNVDGIAAVDGVDVIHLGSNDLLANMGKPVDSMMPSSRCSP